MPAPSVVVQAAGDEPVTITANALASESVPETLPDTAFACVGDTIDVSMQDGFLRCGGHFCLFSGCLAFFTAPAAINLAVHTT